jgi:ABC-2 type transport system permease protein
MRFNRIRSLIIKELLAVWRDKKSRIVLIGPPLMQLIIFTFAATLEVDNVNVAILDRDHGKPSYELIQRIQGSPRFKDVLHLNSRKELSEAIDTQQALLAVAFDANFSKDLAAGRQAKVQVILDGRRSNAAQIALGYVTRMVREMGAEISILRGESGPPADMAVRHWFNPNLDFINHTVPCLVGILTMTVTLLVTALSVAREREMGTFDQLLVSPLRPHEILLGKTVPALIIGFFEGSLITGAAVYGFGIPLRGELYLLFGGMFVFVVAIIGIGLFISSISMTQQQAILGAFTFMAPSIMLSGFATPIDNMPLWLQDITMINPIRHFIVISKGVFLKSMSLEVVWQNAWPMVIIAAFTLIASGWLFGRKLE